MTAHKVTNEHLRSIQEHVNVLMACLPDDLTPQEQMFVDLWTIYVRERSRLSTTKAKARETLAAIERTRVSFKSIIDQDSLENDDTVEIDPDELANRLARRRAE